MRIVKLILPALLALLLLACGAKNQKIENSSPDKKVSITVDGSKPNSLDPWTLKFTIKSGEKTGSISTEFHASDINNENIKFNWLEDDYCEVTLTEQDDVRRTFLVRADDNGIQMQEQKISE